MTKILIHQPEYLPWIHLFEKISNCEKFVILDKVQYNRRSFQNRNKIKTIKGSRWLTVPLKYQERETLISDILIDNSKNWQEQHLRLIEQSYKDCEYFNTLFSKLEETINNKYKYLINLNIDLLKLISNILGLKCEILLQSDLNIISKKSNLILDICKALNCSTYITGIGSKNYLNLNDFNKFKINIEFLEPNKILYKQNFNEQGFINNLSIIDSIFNRGSKI